MTRLNIPLFVALAASLLSAIDARDQLPHQRMIRKRGPAPLAHFEERAAAFVVPRWPGLGARQATETATGSASATKATASTAASASASAASSSSAEASSAAATASSASASAQASASASSSSQSGLVDSLTAVLGGSQSSTVSVASSTSASSSSSSSIISSSTAAPSSSSSVAPATTQAAATSTTPQPTLNIATTPAATQASNPTQSVALIYTTATTAPEAEQSQAAAKAKTAKITRNTIISLVVIASCIGGAIAIWTVIRKWKLSPSERFDDRMQPIDWAPTGGATGVRGETMDEKKHRRVGSSGSHGSFTSGGVGQSELGHGGARSIYSDATGHGNGNAQYGVQAQDFPPAHDFTAGASHGGYGQHQGQQYAGAGYADLRRGPSVTESNYSYGGTYSRGPAYEAQPGAAGVPPLPNPYGGYEEEHNQPAQGQTQVQGQGQYRGY